MARRMAPLGNLSGVGVFQNCKGFVSIFFHVRLWQGFALEAEIVVAIYALKLAQSQGFGCNLVRGGLFLCHCFVAGKVDFRVAAC